MPRVIRNDAAVQRVTRRKYGKRTGDQLQNDEKLPAHRRKPRDEAKHVVGENRQKEHRAQNDFILALYFVQPLIERIFPDEPGRRAVTEYFSDPKGEKRSEKKYRSNCTGWL